MIKGFEQLLLQQRTLSMSIDYTDGFVNRHIGPTEAEIRDMLQTIGYDSLDSFIDTVIPEGIRFRQKLKLPPAITEYEALQELRDIARQNRVARTYVGAPKVILTVVPEGKKDHMVKSDVAGVTP